MIKQVIKKIQINFSDYDCTSVVSNENAIEDYKQIGVDRELGKIIIISKSHPDTE